MQGMHAITPLGAVRAGLAAGSGELPQCNALDLMQGVLACYSMRCDWDPTSCGVGGALGGGRRRLRAACPRPASASLSLPNCGCCRLQLS